MMRIPSKWFLAAGAAAGMAATFGSPVSAVLLAVELLCAAQAIDLRAAIAAPGPAAAAVHGLIREHVPPMYVDREVTPQIEAVRALLPDLVAAAEAVTGPLA